MLRSNCGRGYSGLGVCASAVVPADNIVAAKAKAEEVKAAAEEAKKAAEAKAAKAAKECNDTLWDLSDNDSD